MYSRKFLAISSLVLFLVFLLNIVPASAAVTGKISGLVLESQTNSPLPGANIIIKGTSIGTVSDLKGQYEISRLPLGAFTIVVKYIGYKDSQVDITVTSEKSVFDVDFALEHVTIEGEEVVITAQAAGQTAAINQQLSAPSIKNVVSDARIQEVPDANAAESVGRLPGVSVNRSGGEGNTITVRGLAPRFNLVQVDGVNMGSSNQSSRSTDISGISPNMLAGIEVTKALTADMDANSLGGTVNLQVREAPEGEHVDFIAQGGYNDQEEYFGNYKFVASYSNRYFDNKFGMYASANVEQVNRGTDILNSDWKVNLKTAESDTVAPQRFTYLDRKDIRKRFGINFVMDYAFNSGSLKLTSFYNRLSRISENYSQRIDPDDFDWGFNQSESGDDFTDQSITNLTGKFDVLGGKLDFGAALSYTHRDQPNAISLGGWSQGSVTVDLDRSGPAHLWYNQIIIPYEDLGFGGVNFDSYDTQENEFTYRLNYDYPFNWRFTSGSVKLGALVKHKSRDYKRGNRSGVLSGNDDLIHWLKNDMADVFTEDTQTNNFPIHQAFDDHWDNSLFFDGIYTNMLPFVSKENFNSLAQSTLNFYADNPDASWNTGVAKYQDAQSGSETSIGTYIMPTFNFFQNRVNFIPGLRYEKVEHEYTGNKFIVPFSGRLEESMFDGIVNDTTASSSNENWLPMIHLRVKPAKWFDVRLAYTETLSRPGYQNLVPYFYQDPNSYEGGGGNTMLKPQLSHNWDLYTSFYSNTVGLLTLGGFYKEIDDLIWITDVAIATEEDEMFYGLDPKYNISTFATPVNNEYKGYVGGFEVDLQHTFWYLPDKLNGLVFSANYTFIHSETKYPYSYSELIQKRPPISARVDSFYVAPLEGQPEHVFNASLGYDYGGFSIRVSYMFQQGNLSSRNRTIVLSRYLEDFSRLDVRVQQDLPIKGLEVYLNLNNITDSGDQSYIYDPMYISNRQFYGMTIDGGFRYRL